MIPIKMEVMTPPEDIDVTEVTEVIYVYTGIYEEETITVVLVSFFCTLILLRSFKFTRDFCLT